MVQASPGCIFKQSTAVAVMKAMKANLAMLGKALKAMKVIKPRKAMKAMKAMKSGKAMKAMKPGKAVKAIKPTEVMQAEHDKEASWGTSWTFVKTWASEYQEHGGWWKLERIQSRAPLRRGGKDMREIWTWGMEMPATRTVAQGGTGGEFGER